MDHDNFQVLRNRFAIEVNSPGFQELLGECEAAIVLISLPSNP